MFTNVLSQLHLDPLLVIYMTQKDLCLTQTVDLKEWRGKYIAYIIDSLSHYTKADFVRSKNKDIVAKLIELWFPIFNG